MGSEVIFVEPPSSYKGKIKSQKRDLNWLSWGHISALVHSVKTKNGTSYQGNTASRGPCFRWRRLGLFPEKGEVRRVLMSFWGNCYGILYQWECLKAIWRPFYQAECLSRGCGFFGLPFHKYLWNTSDELGTVLEWNQAKQAWNLHSGRGREMISKILK